LPGAAGSRPAAALPGSASSAISGGVLPAPLFPVNPTIPARKPSAGARPALQRPPSAGVNNGSAAAPGPDARGGCKDDGMAKVALTRIEGVILHPYLR